MARKYNGHYLSEEKKKLAEDNMSLVWWYFNTKIKKGQESEGNHKKWLSRENNTSSLSLSEKDDCLGHLLWSFCLSVESFDENKNIAFSTYAMEGLNFGFRYFLRLKKTFNGRFVITDFSEFDEDGKNIHGIREPEYRPEQNKTIAWEDIKRIFDLIEMTPIEEQIVFFYYEKKYTCDEIGKMMNVSRQRIGQQIGDVTNKLKIAVKENLITICDFVG